MSFPRPAAAVALLTGLTLFAAPAQAQYSESSAWIAPFAGIYLGGSLNGNNSTYGNLNVGSSFTYGARLGYKFNQSVGLVFEYAHADPSVTITNSSSGCIPGVGDCNGMTLDDIHTNVYEGTFNFYFGNTQETQGYIAIGAGADNINGSGYNSSGTKVSASKTYFGTVFGAGVTKMVNEKVGIVLDGRYRWVNVNGADSIYCQPFFPYYCYAYSTSWYGSGEFSLGIKYQFK